MGMIKFEAVPEKAHFVFENMMMIKRTSAAISAKKPRHPIDYNAVDTKTGDMWEMDANDNVYLIPQETE